MGSREFVAPGAVGETVEIGAPCLLEAVLPARFALFAVGSVDRVACQNADLAAVLALVASH